MPDLVSDIVGRIARLPLAPSAAAALMPLHEAFSNSIHAIKEKFSDKAIQHGRIDIQVFREAEYVIGFRIEDNGTGFDDANFLSFLTPDSCQKISLGKKGVGRLSWLKVFGSAHIDSIFQSGGDGMSMMSRSFDFILDQKDQIRNILVASADEKKSGTTITLSPYTDPYKTRCPSRSETIIHRIIAHFLPVFASGACPPAYLHDNDESVNLNDYFRSKIVDQNNTQLSVKLKKEEIELTLHHMKCDKSIRPSGNKYNWMYLCAHERSVTEQCIDNQLGLKLLDDRFIYIGCASGAYLNEHVNQERNDFPFTSMEESEIRRGVAGSARQYLSDYVAAARRQTVKNTQNLIHENPQFIYLNDQLDTFVESLPPTSANNPEEIYKMMCSDRYRRQRTFKRMEIEIKNASDHNAAILAKVEEYISYIDKERTGALAEYVAKRKAILDLLDTLTGYNSIEKQNHHLEEAVHSLICPMKVDSSQLELMSHNLWILDDRLAFFNFFASDKEARQYIDTESRERPDLAFLYDSCLAWREGEQRGDKIVIVEFKPPGKENYLDEDPVRQALRYVNMMKSSRTFRDQKGRVVSNVNEHTSFDCYIVADLTEGLRKHLIGLPLQSTPDGEGMFGYTDNPRAYVEIIPFGKLLRDAKARNAAFFQALGLDG
ncbi:MAG: ATP-binding protein [Magnetococcus sp. YQC-5]